MVKAIGSVVALVRGQLFPVEFWQHLWGNAKGVFENRLQRRTAEHKRGSNHTTHRFGSQVEVVVAKEVPSMG